MQSQLIKREWVSKKCERDLKLGGYNLESTKVENERLIALIILITLAYSYSTFIGEEIKKKKE